MVDKETNTNGKTIRLRTHCPNKKCNKYITKEVSQKELSEEKFTYFDFECSKCGRKFERFFDYSGAQR